MGRSKNKKERRRSRSKGPAVDVGSKDRNKRKIEKRKETSDDDEVKDRKRRRSRSNSPAVDIKLKCRDRRERGQEKLDDDEDRHRKNRRERHRSRSKGSTALNIRSKDRNRREREKRQEKSDKDEDRRNRRKRHRRGSKSAEEKKRKPQLDEVLTRTGGAYIIPAKRRMKQNELMDKSSVTYQRIAWEALKKSINGLFNKINTSNVAIIVRELFKKVNLIRGRGVLCRSIMKAQAASPKFTNVYACLVAIINTKFPNIGELILKRLIIQFRRGYTKKDKTACLAAASFIAHLVNQQVAHEALALEIFTLLLEHPTKDSVQVAIAFLKEVGARIDEVSPNEVQFIFEKLRTILNEDTFDRNVRYMIEVMFQIRKDNFKNFVSIPTELDLVIDEDQITHLVTLDEATDGQDILNVFKADDEYLVNEEKYMSLIKKILEESDSDEEDKEEEVAADSGTVLDRTDTLLTFPLRKTIYLTIQSSLDYEECCHKILRMNIQDEIEVCHMVLDCCAQQRTYKKFFGLLAGRFCATNMKYVTPFESIFKDTYNTVHRLDHNKLRNVAKFFAHLLSTESIQWSVLQNIRLTENDTTSSSRIFVKILFQGLSEYMGLEKLNEKLTDPTLSHCFEGLFPRDRPKNIRFAINFFTTIGLGELTDALREHLKKQPKITAVVAPQITTEEKEDRNHRDQKDREQKAGALG